MNKTPIAVALERQIPEHIREEYALFVDFVKAYYAFLEQTQQRDLEDIRSIDRTLDEFVIRFKKELSALFPTTGLEDERFILQRLREFYKARGSKESYQFLFRAFFNREAEIQYPSTQILRASDGKWTQEKSIFVEAYSGKELFELAGKIIKLKTSKKHIDVYCPRVKYYRAGMYEVFIDRAYTSDIAINDVVSYNDIDVGTISPCPAKYTIIRPGSGFEVGKLYNLPSESGDGSIIKITKIDSNGGIKKIQIISFGLDYETTFFAKLSNTYYQPLEYFHPVSSATIGAWSYNGQTTRPTGFWPSSTFDNNVVDEEGNLENPSNPGAYGDTNLGYIEFGYINRNDYFLYQADYKGSNTILDITESNPDNEANAYYADGTYVGDIIASFYTNASNSVVIDETLAEIQIDLGAVANYPGYYSASDGFISDEIYIQDGKYYQLFSYVMKVEEQLDTYSELIKSLLHPAGFELFAQYNIKNEYLVSAVPLEAFVRYQYFERRFARDTSYWAMHKDVANYVPTIDEFVTYHLDRTGINDTIESYDTYRNLAQPSIHLNKWDITMGNESNPLEDSTYTAVGNFENRTLGDVDTLQWARTLGDFIDLVAESVTGRAIVKGVSTEAPIEAAYATAVHSPGFDWEFAGDTWKDTTQPIGDDRSTVNTPSVWGLNKTDTQSIGDYFDRADAASSSITYDRSIIPLAQDSTLPTIEGITLRALDRTGIADSTNILTYSDNYNYTFAKLKQPQLLGLRATLTAGSKEVTLIGSGNVNTMVGLRVYKVSGTGEFGRSGTYTFNTGGTFEQAQSTYPQYSNLVTSSGGIFTSPTTSINVFGNNTPTLASRGIEFDTTNVLLRSTDGKGKILVVSDTWRYSVGAGSSSVAISPFRVIAIPADGSYVSGGQHFGSGSIPVYGYGVVSILDVTDNARIDVVNGADITKFTVDVAHLASGSVTFYVEASSSETEIADLNGYATATQGNGINWELGSISSPNPAFTKTVLGVDNIPRDNIVIPYDRSTIPLEQTSVTAYSVGLGWDISGLNAFTLSQTASPFDNLTLIERGYGYSESVSTTQSGNNWSFSGDTFYENYSQTNTWATMNHVAAHDFILTNCGYLWGMAANNQTGDATENAFIGLIKLYITIGSATAVNSTGVFYGSFSNPSVYPSTIRGIDGTLVNDYYYGTIDTQNYAGSIDSVLAVKSRIQRFVSFVARQSTNIQAFINKGWLISNAKKDIGKALGDNININSPGTLYYNPYNINTDATTVSSYSSGTYFALDIRAI